METSDPAGAARVELAVAGSGWAVAVGGAVVVHASVFRVGRRVLRSAAGDGQVVHRTGAGYESS